MAQPLWLSPTHHVRQQNHAHGAVGPAVPTLEILLLGFKILQRREQPSANRGLSHSSSCAQLGAGCHPWGPHSGEKGFLRCPCPPAHWKLLLCQV